MRYQPCNPAEKPYGFTHAIIPRYVPTKYNMPSSEFRYNPELGKCTLHVELTPVPVKGTIAQHVVVRIDAYSIPLRDPEISLAEPVFTVLSSYEDYRLSKAYAALHYSVTHETKPDPVIAVLQNVSLDTLETLYERWAKYVNNTEAFLAQVEEGKDPIYEWCAYVQRNVSHKSIVVLSRRSPQDLHRAGPEEHEYWEGLSKDALSLCEPPLRIPVRGPGRPRKLPTESPQEAAE